MKYSFITVTLFCLITQGLYSQEWVVPSEKRDRLSPFKFTDETKKAGEKIYTVNCMSCHGTPGKSNYLNLVPPPGDPATNKIQRNKDGEIFYKVTTGKGQMPSFGSVLSTSEIWTVISYVRSFNPTYKQEVMVAISSSAYPGAEIKLKMSYNHGDTAIILNALAVKDKETVPVSNAAVRLFVGRYFGRLPVDEEKITDKNGQARFRIGRNMPGDTSGILKVSARFSDEAAFGSATADTSINTGTKTTAVSLVAERAMWNRGRLAPLWVILMFSGGVVVVWGFIIVVLLKLRDIFIIGDIGSDDLKE